MADILLLAVIAVVCAGGLWALTREPSEFWDDEHDGDW
jgi:hypothetical protein